MEESKYTNLINKKLSGEITSAEESKLQNWLNNSEENHRKYDQLANLWNITQPSSESNLPNLDEEWHKLSSNLGLNGTSKTAQVLSLEKKKIEKSKVTSKSVWPRYLAAAAVLILMLGLSYWSIFRYSQDFTIVETENAETRKIELSDGSIVKLNSASKLTYLSTFNDSIRFFQLQGEAFFDVVSENRPFIVETQNAKIRVLGTEFNIWSRSAETRVIVKEGTVSLKPKDVVDEEGILLNTNQMGLMQNQKISDLIELSNSENMLGWLEGRIVFNQANLKEVVEELNRIYDLNIRLENSSLSNLSITGNFEKKPIEDVLEAICLTLDIKFRQEGGIYLVYQ